MGIIKSMKDQLLWCFPISNPGLSPLESCLKRVSTFSPLKVIKSMIFTVKTTAVSAAAQLVSLRCRWRGVSGVAAGTAGTNRHQQDGLFEDGPHGFEFAFGGWVRLEKRDQTGIFATIWRWRCVHLICRVQKQKVLKRVRKLQTYRDSVTVNLKDFSWSEHLQATSDPGFAN